MPGASNPVSSTPVSGISQSKSFRTRLGFGGSSGSGASIKPSFFSQLNLKSGRKSLGGPPDFRIHDAGGPVLLIDSKTEYGNAWQARITAENRVSHEPDSSRAQQTFTTYLSDSPSKEASSRAKNNISHSLPPSPIEAHIPSYSLNSRTDLDNFPTRSTTSGRVDPDQSGLSKHLPDISSNLSLLMNEQPPSDTASQSDHHGSQVSVVNTSAFHSRPHQGVVGPHGSPHRSRPSLGNQDNIQPSSPQGVDHTFRPNISAHLSVPMHDVQSSNDPIFHSTQAATENISTSFDLSSARLSLDLMRQGIGEDWAQSVLVESSSIQSGDVSGLLVPPEPSMVGSGSGPITSTPYLSPNASPSRAQNKEPEVSFDLDALDPDLVALLRPNNYNPGHQHLNRIVTPSPLEPFSPPPDPLNPGTTISRPPVTASPPLSPSASRAPSSIPSPVRKFTDLSRSASSSVVGRNLPRTHIMQDILPLSHAPKPVPPVAQLDLRWLEANGHDFARPPPSSSATSPDTGTPSDMSKHPSPLSAPPLTLDDLQHSRRSSPMQSSSASASTSNVTTRRKVRPVISSQTQLLGPSFGIVSPNDRPSSRYTPHVPERDFRSASASPEVQGIIPRTFGSLGRERERARPTMDGLFAQPSPEGLGRPNSADTERSAPKSYTRLNSPGVQPHPREHDWAKPVDRRYRKRSMSLDQSPSEDPHARSTTSTRFRRFGDRDRLTEQVGYSGSEYSYSAAGSLGTPYDGRDPDRERERFAYGYGYGERERPIRPHTDWLGPRTAKAFAAAGLLDDARDINTSRYGGFTRSMSDRDFRTPGSGGSRDRRSANGTFSPVDGEREREPFRFSHATSSRSGDSHFRSSSMRSGAVSPSIVSGGTGPLSRGDSWSHSSHSRPAPLFARTTSDVMSQRGTSDGRDNTGGIRPHTGSAYPAGGGGTGGGSNGSGGGRASPTTTSSVPAMQSQIQTLKDKHDAQTEALLAALADSQRTSKELREENDTLKSRVRSLEERLVQTITNARQKEKELLRATRAKPAYSPDRTRTATAHHDIEYSSQSQARPGPPSRPTTRVTPSPTKRRLSTSSSIFPVIPGTMSLLMAERPGSPQGSFVSGTSPPSPTLVLPRVPPKQKSPERQGVNGCNALPIPVPQPTHKRSMSGASVATSANFSFDTGSPGSLKLKPEHELLLGDMTRLSLATGFGGDSETEN
ncbi:hypothetical protein K439DRAFT_1617439 [Ramaria rubella]|nr:hypothetical protein K439DRAFT_1617439 [Ramaria rubella]